tara:strand:+ start:679 stop:1470 length:792 start_codon:yes stop_codon:yes gene_type:complete
MDIIFRKINNISTRFIVYTEDEAHQRGICFIYWKDADQGDQAISDDGYVSECLDRKVYTDKKSRTKTFVKCAHGVGWVTKSSKFNYIPNKEARCYSYVKPTHWAEKEAGKTRTKNAVTAYIADITSGNKPDWEQIGNIYRPDEKYPEATARRLFKQKRIQTMVEEKLQEILINKGITQDQVLDLQLEALELARNKGDVSNFLRVTENFMDLLQMKPGKKVTTDTVEIDLTNKISDQIEQEDKRLKLERREEVPYEKDESRDIK